MAAFDQVGIERLNQEIFEACGQPALLAVGLGALPGAPARTGLGTAQKLEQYL